jgi:aminomethyltransferase
MTEQKKTPLHAVHTALGARMVPFAGFEMPISYTGIIEEHLAVRERVGIFDVSHMGEFDVSGPGTFDYLNRAVTNDCGKLDDNGVLYSVMCREDGTTIDDLLVARISEERALLVVNASNIQKDFKHLQSLLPKEGVSLSDRSDAYGLLAIQGPQSRELMKLCEWFAPVRERLDKLDYYNLICFEQEGEEVVVSRTGYTGEVGFEVFVPAAHTEKLWNEITETGQKFGISPVGLAARDTLRFEAAYCLYGHELDDETTPLEAGLRWVVKLKKRDGFVGRDALAEEKEKGSRKKLVGLELEGRNIARQDFPVMQAEEVVGRVTSGTFSPTLGKSLCMAYIDADRIGDDQSYSVQVRKKYVGARVVSIPFYSSRAK